MSDAVATMGAILPAEAVGRDAVHVAVIARTATEKLVPGQDVAKDGTSTGPHVGIVDPFLKRPVYPGERYWMFLYPRSTTSLRHEWGHPAFTDADFQENPEPTSDKSASEQWLRDYAARADVPSYHALLAAAEEYIDNGDDSEYLHFVGSDAHGAIPDGFWTHVERALGRKVAHRPTYYSCSC